MKAKFIYVLTLGLIGFSNVVLASDISTLNTFSSGQVMNSVAINNNFSAVKTGVNSKQDKITSNCSSTQAIRYVGSTGAVTCTNIITSVAAGTGLIGGASAGPATLSVAAGGITSREIAAGAVGTNEIATGAVGTNEITDGSITASDLAAGVVPFTVVTAYCGAYTSCGSTLVNDATVVNLRSITIDAPAPGKVTVMFNANALCAVDSTHTWINVTGFLNTNTIASPDSSYPGAFRFMDTVGRSQAFHVNMMRTWTLSSAGTYTYYALMKGGTLQSPKCDFYGGNMTAIYTP